MTKFYLIAFIALNIVFQSMSQEAYYFNNVYNHENGITTGLSIVETDDGYIGYGATIVSGSIGQKLVFIKIGHSGEELIWKQFGNDYQTYFPGNVGGALVKTNDGDYVLAFTYEDSMGTYGSLMKLNNELDTIWKKDYEVSYRTVLLNCTKTNDLGYILTGWVYPSEEDYSTPLLLKTDSLGNYQWHQIYDGTFAKRGQNVIETPDGGYLIGGLRWNPAVYHSMDAMVIKTDSLGNEEWTKYYGNPTVDDGMALVAMAGDGNYLVAMVYGDEIFSNEVRSGRLNILKLDLDGNIISNLKYGFERINFLIKNFRKENDGFIASGLSYETDSVTFQYFSGWMMKLDNNLDSVWYRDYIHEDENWESYFYDASPTSDNGYIAIGKARPDMGGTNNMWILKVDSMGCDTAGCATGVFIEELSPSEGGWGEELIVWPNPAKDQVTLSLSKCAARRGKAGAISIYDLQGIKVEEILIPKNTESIEVDVSKYHKGIYYIQYIQSGRLKGTTKFIKL